MSWLAILLALAGLGGSPALKAEPVKKPCKAANAKHKRCKTPTKPKKRAKPKKPAPSATATPAPGGGSTPPATRPEAAPTPTAAPVTPAPGATATPTPTPVSLPRRTSVDLVEWDVRSSYHTLGAGRITFNVNNLGEDDHNLAVRTGSGPELGRLDLAPGESAPLALELPAGSYVLFCSLLGHEEAGMRLAVTVR